VENPPGLMSSAWGESDGVIQELWQQNSLVASGLAWLALGKHAFFGRQRKFRLSGLSVISISKELNSHIKCLACFEEKHNLCNFFEKLWTLTLYICNYDKSSQHKPVSVSRE